MHEFSAQLAATPESATLRYLDRPGDGVPIVFLHGLGGASTLEYAKTVTRPELTERRVLLVDLLGAGRSDHPVGFGYTVEDHASYLDGFLASLGLSRIVLFGHSLGGAVALSLAALAPQRLAALILTEANLGDRYGATSRLVATQSEESFVGGGYQAMLDEARLEQNPWAETLALAWPAALHRISVSAVQGVQPTWRQILYGLGCRRCYVYGSETLPDADFDELPRHSVQTPVVPGAGHNMAWQNPEGLATVIADFIEPIYAD